MNEIVDDGRLELWAGAECTVNRVGDRWFDQIERTGHASRLDDLDRMAAMGARAVRCPVLWERTAPSAIATADWSWADARLSRIRELGLKPIVGLLHHGSGPSHTSLVDDAFPEKLSEFARAVALRYPWIEDFTPVNEPLTTARFSGLYGLWYPHGTGMPTFARTLVQQCRGVASAMRAIREVTPRARLVQTEDMGTVFSTPRLAYQAAFENERRWLSLDLLCGRVGPGHPLWTKLLDIGMSRLDLLALASEPCPPDIVGLNYYVTSDRFLDDRVERYPSHTHGGNGRDAYADVEAVRVRGAGIVGHAARLEEAWRRYHLPLAFTEVHLGCTREDQLRWLAEAWRGAETARRSGIDVRAVTLWSAFGAVDWDSLLVRDAGHYETGAYDVRAAEPRPTALVALARELADTGQATHPVADQPGWWNRALRFAYPVVGEAISAPRTTAGRPVLIVGATGRLGRAFVQACVERGLAYRTVAPDEVDISERGDVARELAVYAPWAVIYAAGYGRVDEAERDSRRCHRENAWGPAALAVSCREHELAFVTFSSDLVFDGMTSEPYVESDPVRPLGVYARSKAWGERAVLERNPSALVVRSGALFDGSDGFVHRALEALAAGRTFLAARDLVTSPTYVPDLVHSTLDLLIDGERGIWHLANAGAVSSEGLVRQAAEACNVSPRTLVPCLAADLRLAAPRPAYSALASERARLMPPLPDAIARYARGRVALRVSAGAA